MKLILIFISSSILSAQFELGTISAGALFSYSSYKLSEDDKEPTTNFSFGQNVSILTTKPNFSYFISQNVSFDAILGLTFLKEGDSKFTQRLFGVTGTIYRNNFYF